MEALELTFDGPVDAPLVLALAPGAGAPADSPFLTRFAAGVGAAGFRVARFDFPYMVRRSRDGRRRPPDRAPVLVTRWHEVVARIGAERLVVGGKSMGGRIASLVADDAGVRGLVCLGYPFHPPGRPEKTRTEHLESLATPTLVVQGTRDPFGRPEEVAGYRLAPSIEVRWIEDGDHSLVPRKSSGRSAEKAFGEAVDAVTDFLRRL